MTTEEIAYLAGIIDGEGCIGLFTRAGRPDWVRPHLQVTNTDLVLLAWLRERFPFGSVLARRETRKNHKPSWCWRVACDQALSVIELVHPYLVIKRPQADAVLELARIEKAEGWHRGALPRDRHGRLLPGLPAPIRSARTNCFNTIARLNYRAVHRGKRVA